MSKLIIQQIKQKQRNSANQIKQMAEIKKSVDEFIKKDKERNDNAK